MANVRLVQLAAVAMKIPKEVLGDILAEELFFGCYHDGQWERYLPDMVNLEEGIATINVYHFSTWGLGRPSEEEQIKTFAQNYSAIQWQNQQKTKKLSNALSRKYDDLFASMGVTSSSVRNQLTVDIISYLEDATIETGGVAPIDALAQMANSAGKGPEGMQDFQNKLLEYTGKGLTACLEELHNVESGEYTNKFATNVNVLGNLSSALGYIAEGYNRGALESVANLLKGVQGFTRLWC